jgi:hypothetical protein
MNHIKLLPMLGVLIKVFPENLDSLIAAFNADGSASKELQVSFIINICIILPTTKVELVIVKIKFDINTFQFIILFGQTQSAPIK